MDYSLSGLANAINHYKEQYDPNAIANSQANANSAFLGLSIGILIVAFLFYFTIWVVALYLLIKYWKVLPDWAKVLGVLGVIPAVPLGPIVTIVVVLVGKQQ